MENKKQSSIDWLIENAEDFFGNLLAPSIIEKAKEMHKEEIEDTYKQAQRTYFDWDDSNYYNETFIQ